MDKNVKTKVSEKCHALLIREAEEIGMRREAFYRSILERKAKQIDKRNSKEK